MRVCSELIPSTRYKTWRHGPTCWTTQYQKDSTGLDPLGGLWGCSPTTLISCNIKPATLKGSGSAAPVAFCKEGICYPTMYILCENMFYFRMAYFKLIIILYVFLICLFIFHLSIILNILLMMSYVCIWKDKIYVYQLCFLRRYQIQRPECLTHLKVWHISLQDFNKLGLKSS